MSLRPVGNLPASVYWRRRTLVVIPLLFLVILTFYVACSPGGGNGTNAGAGSPVASTSSPATSPSSIGSSTPSSPTPSTTPSTTTKPSTTPAGSSPASTAVAACVPTSLQVAGVTSAPTYKVGTEPVLSLQVTNTGMKPCTQDLADAQIVLTVYNGAARVWGSHDCKIQPGTSVSTLSPNRPVKLSITWTGTSSQPGCKAQRVQVAAGTYTLKATLAKITGVPATFKLT